MVTSIGIDPGTKSLDIYGFDDESGETVIDEAIPRSKVTEDPQAVLDLLETMEVDCIIGPGGYGMPMVRAREASDEQILEATFITPEDEAMRLNIVGLRELMFLMRDSSLSIWFPPGVIHLPTVPEHRKSNRIDLGSADKTSTAIVGIKDEAEHLNIPFKDTSFIILEIGFGYTSALAVEAGKIIDGVGGTVGGPGFMGGGGMDSELAFAIANTMDFPKTFLFRGGAASISGIDPMKTSIEEFVSLRDSETKLGYDAMMEAILKDVFCLLPSVPKPKEILLSGRFPRIPEFREDVFEVLGRHLEAPVRVVGSRGGSKQAAEGAAVLGNGLAGGKYASLVENLEIKNSSGGVFSHIHMGGDVREKIQTYFTRR